MPDRNKKFALVAVSLEAFEIVQDLEAAWCRFTATDAKDQCAVGNAYAALCQRRKELYEYIQKLESDLLLPSSLCAIIRFD
jgi:hypothetical protein